MKIFSTILIALALAAPLPAAGQEPAAPVDIEQLLLDFAREGQSQDLFIRMTHLNDLTTDALFQPPQKYALRAQARGQTMFLVQGQALQETTLNLDLQMTETGALGTRPHRTSVVNIQNMEPGTELTEGTEFMGILALESSIPLQSRMTFIDGLMRIEFEFPPNVRRQLQD